MLKKDKNGSTDWLNKLPQMAKQLEVSLYRNARSFEAYMDMSTLKQRLQQIAVEVSRKARSQGDDLQRDRLHSYTGNVRSDSGGSSSFMGGIPNGSQHQQMSNTGSRGQVMNLDINQIPNSGSSGLNMNGGIGTMGSTSYSARTMSDTSTTLNHRAAPATSSSSLAGGGSQPSKGDPEWQIRIRHKQQRLLLLHHSAKCPHEDGRCVVTQHCADMKRLWKHMEGCKDNQCRVPHCFSSRAILSHYRKCKDTACPACGPVRETVRKSQNRPSSAGIRASSGIATTTGALPGNNRMMPKSTPSQLQTMEADASNFQSSMSQPFNSTQQSQPKGAMAGLNVVSSSNSGMSFSLAGQHSPSGPQQTFIQVSSTGQHAPGTSASAPNDMPSVDPGNGGGSQASSRRNESEWQKVRHKQQRLLLLRHASRCQYTGTCPVTPHCASMKKLWEHIAVCKNSQCSVPHCMSSRYVLSHYRRCKDPRCPACAPVRDSIRKSQEKEKGQGAFDSNAFDGDVGSTGLDPSSIGSVGSSDVGPTSKRSKLDHPGISLTNESMDMAHRIPSSNAAMTSGGQHVSSAHDDVKKVVPSAGKWQAPQSQSSEDRSLLNGFTVEELTTHLASLNRASELPPAKLKQKCSEVLKGLQQHQHGWVFNCPVDPVELGLPDYFVVIKKPMDLGTVHKKLDSGAYHVIEDFQKDVNLTFDNAMTYNEPDTVVYDMAKELKTKFEVDFKKLVAQLDAEDKERRQNERACVLCGCEKRLFEPPVFFCNGVNCASKRIRRNSHFYIGGNNQYFWCNQCFNELDETVPIELIDMTVEKVDLTKKKNDEVHEESWVQCDVCERWIHQICGLFNTRQNKEHHSEYCCPLCLLEKRKQLEATPPPKPPGAADLPRTKLSDFLEDHVASRIVSKRHQMAEDKAKADVSSSCIIGASPVAMNC